MQTKSFKATTIVIPDASNRLVLEAAFNSWSQEARPANILHIYYYHDEESHVRGYQVVYEEAWMPYVSPELPKQEETKRLLV